LASTPLRQLKQRENHWKRCLSGLIVPSSANVGAAEAVDQIFLKDQFFDNTVQEIIEATDADLKAQTQFISGLGPLGENILFGLIGQLRSAGLD